MAKSTKSECCGHKSCISKKRKRWPSRIKTINKEYKKKKTCSLLSIPKPKRKEGDRKCMYNGCISFRNPYNLDNKYCDLHRRMVYKKKYLKWAYDESV